MRIPIYVQKRHIHLSKIDAEKLFGNWYVFWKQKIFTQPWEYFTTEKLTIKWPLWTINDIDIIIPFRKFTQVEISDSDNKFLGIDAKPTQSWSLQDAAPITIIWPKGSIYVDHAAIISIPHIHMSVAQAKIFWFKHNQIVSVKIPWNNNKIIENVKIRTNDKYDLDFHINADEWGNNWLKTNDRGEI